MECSYSKNFFTIVEIHSLFKESTCWGFWGGIHKLSFWWQVGKDMMVGSLLILMIISGLKTLLSTGKMLFGSTGLYLDIISFCGWLWWGSLELKIDFGLFQHTFCIVCRQDEEIHSHLLFACSWTSLLCSKLKSWRRINRHMVTLNNIVRGLASRSKNLEARMRRVSLGLTIYLIWEERKKYIIFDSTYNLVYVIFCKFQ